MQNCLTYVLLSVFITLFYVTETGGMSVAVGPISPFLQICLRRFVQSDGCIVLNFIDKVKQPFDLFLSFRL